MKREDICTIVKDVASQFGYEYRDHLGLIYLTKEEDEIEVCCCHELPQSINLFSRVFDFDPSFTSDDIINLISQMNTRSEFCSFHYCRCGRRVCWKSVSGDLFWFYFMGLFSTFFKRGRKSEP